MRDEIGLRLGYACVNTDLPSPARTSRLANATPERLRELIAADLDAIEAILRWNDAHDMNPRGGCGAECRALDDYPFFSLPGLVWVTTSVTTTTARETTSHPASLRAAPMAVPPSSLEPLQLLGRRPFAA